MLLSGLILRTISVFISPYAIVVDGMPKNESQVNESTPYLPFHLQESETSLQDPARKINSTVVTLAAILRVNKNLSSTLRQIALATILTRAGLGLKPSTLRRTLSGVLRLTCIPCLTEALTCTVVSKYLMNWPWSWACMMGLVHNFLLL